MISRKSQFLFVDLLSCVTVIGSAQWCDWWRAYRLITTASNLHITLLFCTLLHGHEKSRCAWRRPQSVQPARLLYTCHCVIKIGPFKALFTNLSAASFPSTPTWAVIQQICTSVPRCWRCSWQITVWLNLLYSAKLTNRSFIFTT